MLKKMFCEMKNMVKESVNKTFRIVKGVAAGAYIFARPVYATASYTAPIDNFKTVLITLMASAGVAVLGYAVWHVAHGFIKKDPNEITGAIGWLIGGGVLLGGGVILGVLGA